MTSCAICGIEIRHKFRFTAADIVCFECWNCRYFYQFYQQFLVKRDITKTMLQLAYEGLRHITTQYESTTQRNQ